MKKHGTMLNNKAKNRTIDTKINLKTINFSNSIESAFATGGFNATRLA